jgi:DNA-binding HxlR family transcriptional regulator
MEKLYSTLEKTYSIHILVNLYDVEGKITAKDLMAKIGCSSNVTFNERLDDLKEVNLIDYEKRPTVKNGKIIGGGRTKWIWLTPKGRKVAEKLLEIKKIMEEER